MKIDLKGLVFVVMVLTCLAQDQPEGVASEMVAQVEGVNVDGYIQTHE